MVYEKANSDGCRFMLNCQCKKKNEQQMLTEIQS